jgi:RNA ligase (TIGR02306 family)
MSSLIVDVCKIVKVEKHPNADRLDLVTVKGWNCIVGRDNYKVGDLVIYCPPDSVIPNDIIEKHNLEYLKKDGRVGTVKLRKCISQGLILSIPEGKDWKEGKEVAKELGITKYEPPIERCSLNGGRTPTKKKLNPLFDKYTDIENVKNFNTAFTEEDDVVITEKIHGTNFRAGTLPRYRNNLIGKILSFLFGKYEFVYGSHNVQKTPMNIKMGFYGEDVYGRIAKKYNLKEVIPKDYIIYGEIYGKGIQELEYDMKDIDVRFFDVKYKGRYLDFDMAKEFFRVRNLRYVPILYYGKYSDEVLKEHTEGNSTIALNQIREGCVVKPIVEQSSHFLHRKILKSINPEYLCKKNRTERH